MWHFQRAFRSQVKNKVKDAVVNSVILDEINALLAYEGEALEASEVVMHVCHAP